MHVTNLSFGNNFIYDLQQLESQQSTLQTQTSTGLKVTQPEDDPSAMNQVLNLQTEAGSNTQYETNIASLQNSATTASDALNSLQTLMEQASEIATNANGVTSPTQLSTYATQVGQLVQQALQIANTKDAQGNYIFAGTNNSTAPFSSTTDASGNITGVTYSGNASVAQTQIGPTLTASAQTPGENNTGTGTDGVFADSRSGADIFSHLIALQQDLSSGNTSAISSNDGPNLSKDEDHVVSQISANGVMQSTLDAASTTASQKALSITNQMSNDTSADLATTLTQLSQTQTAYQAALESGTLVMQTSILTYLE